MLLFTQTQMLKTTLVLCFISAMIYNGNSHAQYDVKDQKYFTKDGSDFSAQEMDQEAEYIERTVCGKNSVKSNWYECTCIGKMYRQHREIRGVNDDQSIVYSALLEHIDSKSCIDSEGVYANTKAYCENFKKTFSSDKNAGEDYCECVGENVAKEFKAANRQTLGRLGDLRVSALKRCEN